jgi:predicted nucleotidyltransferase
VLDERQRAVAEQVLEEEERERRHVVVALSGAHAYGFPSPDSDLDLKAIHVAPTAALLGLAPPRLYANRFEVVEGVEIDYSSNELGAVLLGILEGNGNYVERVLGAHALRTSSEHEELRDLARAALSRRVWRHYRGFATGQLHDLQESERATAKKVLYVLRTALTGAHLLATGELVTDLTALLDDHGFADARALVERKRCGERVFLEEEARTHWMAALDRAFAILEAAYVASPLPDDAPNRGALEAWLLDVRRRLF